MSEITTRLFRHMAWANQEVFRAVAALPHEALQAYVTNESFDVATILQHIVQGAEWYAYCTTGTMWRDRILPATSADVLTLATELAELDALLLAQVDRPDEDLRIEDEHGVRTNKLSTVLGQTIHHATEHRAQLVSALEARGYNVINLDELDVWAFERASE